MKTSELTEAALDWAVAKALGLRVEFNHPYLEEKVFEGWWQCGPYHWQPLCSYSTDWTQGGPIIEREFIELTTTNRSNNELWEALGRGFGEDCPTGYGPTPLIAAMRCYVASKLGDEVEIPQQLIT